MSANDPYFQFPLVLLAFGENYAERLQFIVSHSIVETGTKLRRNLSSEQETEIVTRIMSEQPSADIVKSRAQHRNIAIGVDRLRVTLGHISGTISNHDAAARFVADMAREFGPWPHTRIRNIYLWDTLSGSMPYREFAVLCALYAVIGEKDYPVRVTRDRIRAGAMGYKSTSMLKGDVGARLMAQRKDGAAPLTTNQLRWTLDTLETKGHFARCHVSARQTYFSHRMSGEEMRKRLLEWKTKRAFVLGVNREQDQALRLKITTTNGKSPPSHHYNRESEPPFSSSDSHHATTTDSPRSHHGVTTEPTTIIETLSEKLPSEKLSLEKHTLSLRVEEEEAGEAKTEPSQLLPESIAEVESFFESLKRGASEYAAEYWEHIQTKPPEGNWRWGGARWALDGKRRRRESTAA